MPDAIATYEVLSPTAAIVEVTYTNGRLGIARVDVRFAADLYEAAYGAASVKATMQGDRLGSFRQVTA